MAFSLLMRKRTVLMLFDEFLSIYAVEGGGVARLQETVPWDLAEFDTYVANVITQDCRNAPVLIINDMVEQHYRKERVLRFGVGFADKITLVQRKLNVAFPNLPVRAAYPLKEKAPQTDKQAASDIYIFAAVSASEQLLKTISAVKKSFANIAGFCFLPVESSDLVRTLSSKLIKSGSKKTAWSIFIGQHRNGSLRQIVTKNGELALTRMSPVTDSYDHPDAWAQDVYQEFKATMSYLSRFGYDEDEGLNVAVAANMPAGEALASLIKEKCELHIMTVVEAAQTLGMSVGREQQDSFRYADALHASWIGRKNRLILPVKTALIETVSRPRKMAMIAMFALFGGVVFQLYQFLGAYSVLSAVSEDLSVAHNQKAQLDTQYQDSTQKLKALGFDVQLVQSSLAVHAQLEKTRIKILDLLEGIGNALERDLRIDNLEVAPPKRSELETMVEGEKEVPSFEARLGMLYPSTSDVDRGNKEVTDLRDRLEKQLPHHVVKITKLLMDYGYTKGLVIEAGDMEKKDTPQDFVAEILVQGPLINQTKEAAP